MIYLKTYENYLILEGRKEDLETKFKKEFGDELGEKLYSFDTTKNKAYSDWLFKFYKNNKDEVKNLEHLRLLLDKYIRNSEFLSKPISKMKTLIELSNLIDEKRNLNNLEDYHEDEVILWYNSIEWCIFQPFKFEYSKYAFNTERNNNRQNDNANWCTTWDDEHFSHHFGEFGSLLYCINKIDYKKDIAFELKPSERIDVWNYQDNEVESDMSIYGMKDFFKNEDIYKIFDDTIEHEIQFPNLSREELIKRIKKNQSEIGIGASDQNIIDALDETDFVEDNKKEEIKYYTENTIELVEYYDFDTLKKLFIKYTSLETVLNFYGTTEENLLDTMEEYDFSSASEFITDNRLDKKMATRSINYRFEGYTAIDILYNYYGYEDSMDRNHQDWERRRDGGIMNLTDILSKIPNYSVSDLEEEILSQYSTEELMEIIKN